MSIEEIKKRLIEIKERAMITENLNDDRADVNFLLSENQRLVEALERLDDRKHGMLPRSEMARIAKEALQAYKLLEKKD